jgi:hypothetical protein
MLRHFRHGWIALLWLAGLGHAAPVPMLNNLGGGSARNDWTGTVGFLFTTGPSTTEVTALGFVDWENGNGLLAAHQVGLWSNSTLIASVTVPAGAAGFFTNQFYYVNLTSPVTLAANTTYTLGAQVFSGGDKWPDHNAAPLPDFTAPGFTTYSPLAATNCYYNSVSFDRPSLPAGAAPGFWALCNLLGTVSSSAGPAPMLGNSGGGTARNDWNGTVGYTFTTGPQFLCVTALGFVDWENGDGLAAAHQVGLWQDGALLASVTVPAGTSGFRSGRYWYASLASPLVLPANTTYTMAAEVFNGGDKWPNNNGSVNPGYASPDFAGFSPLTSANNRYNSSSFSYPPQAGNGSSLWPLCNLLGFATNVPPSLTSSPQNAWRYEGEALALSAQAIGTPPLNGQWWKDGTNRVAGATNSTLTLAALTTADGGHYTFVAVNPFGSVTSAVAQVTVQAVAGISTALAGHWRFDEASGTTAADASGNGRHGTIYPGPTAQWTSGRIGGALALRGPGLGEDYVAVTNMPGATNGTMTLALWVRDEAPTDAPFTGDPAGAGLQGLITTAANLAVGLDGGALPSNQWHHLAMVADGLRLHFYRNGVETQVAPYDGTLLSVTNVLCLGAQLSADTSSADSGWWQGALDDAAFWTRGLSTNELALILQAADAGYDLSHADAFRSGTPALSAQPLGGNLVLSWPPDVTGFILEFSDTLPAVSWTPVSGVVSNSVTIVPTATGNGFFRLRLP